MRTLHSRQSGGRKEERGGGKNKNNPPPQGKEGYTEHGATKFWGVLDLKTMFVSLASLSIRVGFITLKGGIWTLSSHSAQDAGDNKYTTRKNIEWRK
jgi:hypothetical protein